MSSKYPHGALAALGAAMALAACGGGGAPEAGVPPAPEPVTAARSTAQAPNPMKSGPGDGVRLLVKLKNTAVQQQALELSAEVNRLMSLRAGVEIQTIRNSALGLRVLELPGHVSPDDAQDALRRLRASAEVEYAEPEHRAYISATVNDKEFAKQWSLAEPERVAGGINAVGAWDISSGNAATVVAVLDTGVLSHRDLQGRLLPGYDFVSNTRSANDGGGRDADARDPGDFLSTSDAAFYGRTSAEPSSWHGTHVAGIIAATANNQIGVAGIAHQASILPVRVLGKGGGTSADIADGIVWAAGGSVPGVPLNPKPAKIINMSLGGPGQCSLTYQNAINFARSRGVTVIVAAGNEATLASNSTPANCAGVVAVAATGRSGAQASYSNFGSAVTLAAPGGDHGDLILSLGDGGETTPRNDGSTMYTAGTSMAAPAVAGVAALLVSVNPQLMPDQVRQVLQDTASRFPTGTGRDCSKARCGAGLLNAMAALRMVSSGSVGDTLATPKSGWWWNENEGGRGYALEIRNGALFMAGFMYARDGAATWFVSSGELSSPTRYSGTMIHYADGQTLSGPFKAAVYQGGLGTISLNFTAANRGTLTWPDGSSTTIRRYDMVSNGAALPQQGFAPEAGWWWSAAEPGRGFALEVQGNHIFVGGFMYGDDGKPMWYVSGGAMSSASEYSGNWLAYANGQAMGMPYQAPQVVNPNVGTVKLSFMDPRNARLSLPDGRQIEVTRYLGYGTNTPLSQDPPGLTMLNRVLGKWAYSYRIISVFTDDIAFDRTMESSSQPGDYFAVGLNRYDDLTVVKYDEDSQGYYMLSKHPEWASFDSFYTYTLDASGQVASGCYYLLTRSDNELSSCFTLSGIKVANSGVHSAPALAAAERQAQLRTRMEQVMAGNAADGEARRGPLAAPAELARRMAAQREAAALRQAADQLRAGAR